jgi:hypothetical protein
VRTPGSRPIRLTNYQESAFNIRPAPEFATAEVVVASLYRAAGFPHLSERDVPAAGREFDRLSQATRGAKLPQGIGRDTWRTVLHGVLESPKQPNQSSRRFLQLSPVVPDAALYSGSARLTGNSWNPGLLIQRMILIGSESDSDAESLWGTTYDALTVQKDDDIWARWLQEEFEKRRKDEHGWGRGVVKEKVNWPHVEKQNLVFPARQFVKDLVAVLGAKNAMTRRQWISLLEAILRIGSVSHVLWLCEVNERIWRALRAAVEGADGASESDLADEIFSSKNPFLEYGNPGVPIIRDYASRYLVARLGINLVLWQLHAMGSNVETLSSGTDIAAVLQLARKNRRALLAADLIGEFNNIKDEQARTVACKKGIGSNLIEFGRHTLGQRQTNSESLRGYDQGYVLRKRGEHKSSPWIVSLGPVAVLALTHCCLKEAAGPRSIRRLCDHLSWYGINIDQDDVSKSDLGRKLRMLGLVLDSPDAESGMLLVPPFSGGTAPDSSKGMA